MQAAQSSIQRVLVLTSFIAVAAATWAYATPEDTTSPRDETISEETTANAAQEEQQLLFEKFAATLTQATLIGNFTETNKESNDLSEERYEIASVEHVEGENWLFRARIKYGENDVTLPMTLPVRWAGDTPVICVDNLGFPGLGTYTARVMIYSDHYAGFWTGGDHGGHLFGVIQRGPIDEPKK